MKRAVLPLSCLLLLALPGLAACVDKAAATYPQDGKTGAASAALTIHPPTPAPSDAPLPASSPVQQVESSTPDPPKIAGGIFEGSGFVIDDSPPTGSKAHPEAAKDLALNFVNADIHDVAKSVLGDTLGLNYVVAPAVQGTITLKVNQPVPQDALFATLDTAFRLSGAALVSADGLVKVVPLAEAPRQARPVHFLNGRQTTPGFGLQIVPLRYISAGEMQKILAQATPGGNVVPVEGARNVLILAGTEEERSVMTDVVSSFDVDWLTGMSFGLFPLKEADAKTVTRELWDVLGSMTGSMSKVIRLVPFDRLNAILVVSAQPRYLKELKTWIDRLDVNQAPSDRKIWVYRVQNGRAADLSGTLQKLIQEQGSKTDTPAKTTSANAAPAPALPFSFDNGAAKDVTTAGSRNIPPPPTPDALPADTGDPGGSSARIIADETTNSLIIWATKAEFSLLEDALKKLDITPLQVRIEAVVAEVTLTDDLRYGLQYFFQTKHTGAILTNATTTSISSTLPGFSAFITGSHISAILDLLQDVTTVHVISSPQLMVLNNQTAVLQVGDQVPIATQSAVSTLTPGAPVVNSIEMKDTGVILKVTPRVNASGMVLMDIAQEVSGVTTTTTSTIDSPTIQQRKIASSIAVRDGETIALGGLIQDSRTDGKNGIPVLQNIPVVGSVFGTTTNDVTRTELVALITPRVIKNDNDVREVTAEMREQMSAVMPLDARIHP
jgi:general secretion pathway protein D